MNEKNVYFLTTLCRQILFFFLFVNSKPLKSRGREKNKRNLVIYRCVCALFFSSSFILMIKFADYFIASEEM